MKKLSYLLFILVSFILLGCEQPVSSMVDDIEDDATVYTANELLANLPSSFGDMEKSFQNSNSREAASNIYVPGNQQVISDDLYEDCIDSFSMDILNEIDVFFVILRNIGLNANNLELNKNIDVTDLQSFIPEDFSSFIKSIEGLKVSYSNGHAKIFFQVNFEEGIGEKKNVLAKKSSGYNLYIEGKYSDGKYSDLSFMILTEGFGNVRITAAKLFRQNNSTIIVLNSKTNKGFEFSIVYETERNNQVAYVFGTEDAKGLFVEDEYTKTKEDVKVKISKEDVKFKTNPIENAKKSRKIIIKNDNFVGFYEKNVNLMNDNFDEAYCLYNKDGELLIEKYTDEDENDQSFLKTSIPMNWISYENNIEMYGINDEPVSQGFYPNMVFKDVSNGKILTNIETLDFCMECWQYVPCYVMEDSPDLTLAEGFSFSDETVKSDISDGLKALKQVIDNEEKYSSYLISSDVSKLEVEVNNWIKSLN